MSHMEDACESIDASVFSSDMLFDDERRNILKDYIGRWTRAIEAHEDSGRAEELARQDDDNDDDDSWAGDDMMGASG